MTNMQAPVTAGLIVGSKQDGKPDPKKLAQAGQSAARLTQAQVMAAHAANHHPEAMKNC